VGTLVAPSGDHIAAVDQFGDNVILYNTVSRTYRILAPRLGNYTVLWEGDDPSEPPARAADGVIISSTGDAFATLYMCGRGIRMVRVVNMHTGGDTLSTAYLTTGDPPLNRIILYGDGSVGLIGSEATYPYIGTGPLCRRYMHKWFLPLISLGVFFYRTGWTL